MITGQPRVVRLKNFKSSLMRHSSALSRPMAPLRATAAIRLTMGEAWPPFSHRSPRARMTSAVAHPVCILEADMSDDALLNSQSIAAGKRRRRSPRRRRCRGAQLAHAEGISVKPLYTAADVKDLPHADTLPGFAPFVRGPQATMYAVRRGPFAICRLLHRRGVE